MLACCPDRLPFWWYWRNADGWPIRIVCVWISGREIHRGWGGGCMYIHIPPASSRRIHWSVSQESGGASGFLSILWGIKASTTTNHPTKFTTSEKEGGGERVREEIYIRPRKKKRKKEGSSPQELKRKELCVYVWMYVVLLYSFLSLSFSP